MLNGHLRRVLTLNFVSAMVLTLVVCYFLKTLYLMDVIYIANLFGLYYLVVYGINMLIDSGHLENNRERFIVVIGLILVFDVVFLLMSLIMFTPVFGVNDYLTMVFNGARIDLSFNIFTYLAIFAVLMLIFNVLLYFKERNA